MSVERLDVTRWVIHFVRNRDPEIDPAVINDDELDDPVSAVLDADATAFEVLMSILREGALRASWSFRGGKPTIYGGRPAVCFTEMPLLALATYAQERRRRTRVAPYGLAVLKRELFAAGGRPVIYGLSTRDVRDQYDPPFRRLLPEDVLPLREQYRYVTLAPTAARGSIDWTHEREWRWAPRERETDAAWVKVDHFGATDMVPALPLFRPAGDGGTFTRVAIVVERDKDVAGVLHQLHAMRDAGISNLGEEFDPEIIARSFVVVLEDAVRSAASGEHLAAMRIETLPETCIRPIVVPKVSDSRLARVRKALADAKKASRKAVANRRGHASREIRDVYGGAWVVTYAGSHLDVQALVAAGAARANGDGYYTIDAVDRVGGGALCLAEAAAEAAASVLTSQLDVAFHVHTWWD